MILAQVGALLLLAGVALGKVYAGDATPESIEPSFSWFNPFEIESRDALISRLLIGVFIYWGWESAVNLAEETKDSRTTSGLAALTSTLILLVTYLAVATAVVAFAGVSLLEEFDDDDALFGDDRRRRPRLAVGQARHPRHRHLGDRVDADDDHPRVADVVLDGPLRRPAHGLASIHPRFQTPHVSTIVVAALAVAWYVPANFISENFLFDTLSALALMIAFYYALSGLACVVYLPARAHQVGHELPLHRRRAADRGGAARVPLLPVGEGLHRPGRVVHGAVDPRRRRPARDRARLPAPRASCS